MSLHSTSEVLSDWVDERHLAEDAMAGYLARFQTDAFTSLVLDEFLLRTRLLLLQKCFGEDAAFTRNYGLIDPIPGGGPSFAERTVDEATFNSSPDDVRLARESVMTGYGTGRGSSEGWTANLGFIGLLGSEQFAAYLTAITGIGDLREVTFLPRVMKWGDFCRAHDDTAGTRRLCMLFYVDDDWRPGFGGRFQHLSDGEPARSIEPIGNRVILHEPRTDRIHRVEHFTSSAVLWERCTYSIWFSSEA